jgi:hypothetical protein
LWELERERGWIGGRMEMSRKILTGWELARFTLSLGKRPRLEYASLIEFDQELMLYIMNFVLGFLGGF